MANYYAKAIDILETDVDFRKLVVEIAKCHPKAVVDAYKRVTLAGYDSGSWQAEVIPILELGKKLEAVKVCKNHTGETLVKAKEMVEALMEELK